MWIVVAVLFVAIVATFYYVFVYRIRQMSRYGRLALPCDSEIELPGGEVTIYYEDRRRWKHNERPQVDPSFSLSLEHEGERIELGPPLDETPVKTSKVNRIPYARVELPRPGVYRVRGSAGPDVHDPQVALGRA